MPIQCKKTRKDLHRSDVQATFELLGSFEIHGVRQYLVKPMGLTVTVNATVYKTEPIFTGLGHANCPNFWICEETFACIWIIDHSKSSNVAEFLRIIIKEKMNITCWHNWWPGDAIIILYVLKSIRVTIYLRHFTVLYASTKSTKKLSALKTVPNYSIKLQHIENWTKWPTFPLNFLGMILLKCQSIGLISIGLVLNRRHAITWADNVSIHWCIWWRHQMETFFALLAFVPGNSPVTGEFPAQRPVTWSFDVFFDLRLNQQLGKQWRRWWFETLSRSLWPHCYVTCISCAHYGCLIWVGRSNNLQGSWLSYSVQHFVEFDCDIPRIEI